MEWMLAAISAPLSASIITAVLFFAFARSERDKALTLLAWSWVVYASRLTFEAVALLIPAAPWIWYLVQVAAVASALLMLSGVARLVGTRAPWRIFLAFGLAAVAALYVLGQTELHPAIVAMPSFALQGVARIMTGVALLKVERERGPSPRPQVSRSSYGGCTLSTIRSGGCSRTGSAMRAICSARCSS